MRVAVPRPPRAAQAHSSLPFPYPPLPSRLFENTHPDMYIPAYMPGGSLFMRNSPPPLSVVYPQGIPEGVSQRTLNPDMSNPETTGPTPFLVDSANKKMY